MRAINHHWHLIVSFASGLIGLLALTMAAILQSSQVQASTTTDLMVKTRNDSYEIFLPAVLNKSRNLRVYALVGDGESGAREYSAAMAAFELKSGIQVVFEGSDDFENEVVQRAASGMLPDVAFIPQPGLLGDLGAYTVNLNDWFSTTYLQEQYDQNWLNLASKNGKMSGIWYRTTIKSLVWYPKADFSSAGYQVPISWDELVALSDQIVANGDTPWCVGIESGSATGWPGTDWVEDIMLRTTTPQNYDRWVVGDLKFSSSEVKNAWEMMADIWFTENYVFGGRAEIPNTSLFEAVQPMFEDPPGCYLYRMSMFIKNLILTTKQIGVDVDYFLLPPIDPQYGDAVLTAGDLAAAFNDRIAVREFVKYLTTKESVQYFVDQGTYLSPHKDATIDWYPDELEGFGKILINADTIRFDGSDQMPKDVGAGTFWQGIVDYVNDKDLNTILADIDACWP